MENPYLKFIRADGSIDHTVVNQIAELENPLPQITKEEQQRLDRDQAIIALYEQGHYQANIGKQYNLSRERIRQIVGKERCEKRRIELEVSIQINKQIKHVMRVFRLFIRWAKHDVTQYASGKCKCPICTEANNKRCRTYRRNNPKYKEAIYAWIKNNPKKVEKYKKKWSKNYLAALKAGRKEHCNTSYIAGCRCKICRAANALVSKTRKDRIKLSKQNSLNSNVNN